MGKELTKEQQTEFQVYAWWDERTQLTDEQIIWLCETYPEYFEVKENVFDMKKFKSAFNIN